PDVVRRERQRRADVRGRAMDLLQLCLASGAERAGGRYRLVAAARTEALRGSRVEEQILVDLVRQIELRVDALVGLAGAEADEVGPARRAQVAADGRRHRRAVGVAAQADGRFQLRGQLVGGFAEERVLDDLRRLVLREAVAGAGCRGRAGL